MPLYTLFLNKKQQIGWALEFLNFQLKHTEKDYSSCQQQIFRFLVLSGFLGQSKSEGQISQKKVTKI